MATILCISITFIIMDQSVSLNREIIIKESDVNISYNSVEKSSLVSITLNSHLLRTVEFPCCLLSADLTVMSSCTPHFLLGM